MTMHTCNSYRHGRRIGAIIPFVVAGLIACVSGGTADAGPKGGGVKAPAAKTAAITTQGQIGRNQNAPRPSKATYDKTCQRNGHRPRGCFPHPHPPGDTP
jgi:hypothetical protein